MERNPADSNYVQPFLERHRQLYGKVPQSAWDGGFASAANLSWAKEQGVQDVAFSKKCGLTVESMVRSSWVYKQLPSGPGSRGALGRLKHTFRPPPQYLERLASLSKLRPCQRPDL